MQLAPESGPICVAEMSDLGSTSLKASVHPPLATQSAVSLSSCSWLHYFSVLILYFSMQPPKVHLWSTSILTIGSTRQLPREKRRRPIPASGSHMSRMPSTAMFRPFLNNLYSCQPVLCGAGRKFNYEVMEILFSRPITNNGLTSINKSLPM